MSPAPAAPPDRGLSGMSVPLAGLTAAVRGEMYELLGTHFDGVSPETFDRDLAAKQHVILLRDVESGALKGFSTLAVSETLTGAGKVSVAYSGDTIVEPDAWGTTALPRAWIRTVLAATDGMSRPLFWLLLSSGYRTYRFLPTFFREFYPRHDAPAPESMQRLIDELASRRFGKDFDAAAGVVRFARGATPLRRELAVVPPHRRRNDHVAFFLDRNPGHARGDELVCIARVDEANFTSAARRMLGR